MSVSSHQLGETPSCLNARELCLEKKNKHFNLCIWKICRSYYLASPEPIHMYSWCKQWIFWPDCAHAQAILHLHCTVNGIKYLFSWHDSLKFVIKLENLDLMWKDRHGIFFIWWIINTQQNVKYGFCQNQQQESHCKDWDDSQNQYKILLSLYTFTWPAGDKTQENYHLKNLSKLHELENKDYTQDK